MGQSWRHKSRKRSIRPIRVEGGLAYVALTRGMTAVIDAADVALVEGRNWSALKSRGGLFYAGRGETVAPYIQMTVLLHRAIMGADDDRIVEHRDRDPMNCRRSNLRFADQTINNQNASLRSNNVSGFRGVRYKRGKRRTKPWLAQLNYLGNSIRLGGHPTAEMAARAYDSAALKFYGPGANLNFTESSNG